MINTIMKRGVYKSEEEEIRVFNEYVETEIKIEESAEKLGYSIGIFRRRLKYHGLQGKKNSGRRKGEGGRPRVERKIYECLHCGCKFEDKVTQPRKFCSQACLTSSDYMKEIHRNTDRSYTQTEEFSRKQSNPNTPEYKKYSGKVHRLTKKTYEIYKEEINPDDHPRTVCGVEGGYQLDHIITIKFGFENNIPPEVLAEKENLRMLPWKENLMRNWNGTDSFQNSKKPTSNEQNT